MSRARWVEQDGERRVIEEADFKEALHPRGRGGKFIAKLGKLPSVSTKGLGTAAVGGVKDARRVHQIKKGERQRVKAANATMMGVDKPSKRGLTPEQAKASQDRANAISDKLIDAGLGTPGPAFRKRAEERQSHRASQAYLETALWASIDEQPDGNGGPPMDEKYGVEDIAPESVERMRRDVADFISANADDLGDMDLEQIGHNLWLTRNYHGAGFWDMGLGERGDRLTKAAHALGEQTLYVGDDGLVYAEPDPTPRRPMQEARWVEREGQRFLVEADGKCAMPHAAMSKRGKKVCPNCKAKIGDEEKTEVEEVALEESGYATDADLVEAVDSMRKATQHKHGLEVAPGKQDNWIEKMGPGGKGGQLPAYIQHIALAIEKKGKTKSQAIAIAIGTVKRWAAGGGKVDANTRAAAAKALGEWTKLKAKAKAKA